MRPRSSRSNCTVKHPTWEKVAEVDEEAFKLGLSIFGRKDYTGETTWEAYRNWIVSQGEGDSDVLLGSLECNKTDGIGPKIKEIISGLGLEYSYTDVKAMWKHHDDLIPHWWDIRPKMGENLYHSTGCDADVKVQFEAVFRKPTANKIANIEWLKTVYDVKSSLMKVVYQRRFFS